MKKLTALLLAVMLVASMAVAVSAESTTTLTTTVPAATYTLNIPADQEIPFSEVSTDIGNVTVTDAIGFADGKNLKVAVTYDAFTSEGCKTTIPFALYQKTGKMTGDGVLLSSGQFLTFEGNLWGGVDTHPGVTTPYGVGALEGLVVRIESEDWGKALAGDYTATITFTAEVVVEE